MNWILDGAVAVVILGCAVAAWRKGLIRAVLGFLPMALALLGTKAVSPFIGRFLRETILFDKMSAAIQTSMGLDTALQEGAMQTQTALIEAMPLPEFLKEALLENNNPVIYQLLHAESLKESRECLHQCIECCGGVCADLYCSEGGNQCTAPVQ